MAMAFERWADQIAATEDEQSRRELLAELGGWRAARLTDIPALRDAAFAMSRLYALTGNHQDAVREAHALLSLCHTVPPASQEEIAQVRAYLASLGVTVEPQPQEKKRPKVDPTRRAREAAAEEKWESALRLLAGKGGGEADLLRAYVYLARAMSIGDPVRREEALKDLRGRLRGHLRIEGRPKQRQEPPATNEIEQKLASLLGLQSIPSKRDARIRVMEVFASEHPEEVDQLAALALQHHVAMAGLKSPAPWLVGFVVRAMASGPATETRKVRQHLRDKGAFAITAYDEWPFNRAAEILADALRDDWDFISLRRGILPRGEPVDHKIWTLRISKDFQERMFAVAPSTSTPHSPKTAQRLARRLTELCPIAVLVAPGEGNALLRQEVAATGGHAVEDDANTALLARLLESSPSMSPPPPQQAPAKPKAPPTGELLAQTFMGETPPAKDELVALIRQLPRVYRAFRVARTLDHLPSADADLRLATLLEAADEAAPPQIRLNEGSTLAILFAAQNGNGKVAALLQEGSTAERFGGPGVDVIVALVKGLLDQKWQVDRILRGPTRRERQDFPVLDAIAEEMRSLWRIVAEKDGVSGEIWYLVDLPPEGRAGIPQLLLRDKNLTVVAPIDPDLLEWYSTLRGPAAIGWTGDEFEAVGESLQTWS